ncbi:PadR family transcriptional regulator [Anaerocolumna xylanovorans]|uniref:DNA-binding transcriptional regulator, PadR family n=1 Tax=Anaerocolumna xylanovorans DSM 12503 TaxID=1121345 RepID=A0A1M7XZK5_9FIRM|nr:PadR family transcriptional regulator [Anaerocolumna xylanovorans]SHO44594.1 DNA-binding transcriptional regulator, PadR family [Anaerocolumna xylanovorans DSM 12503]
MPIKKNKTRYVILGLLNEEHLSGYEIKRIIDTRLSFFWSESFGQIYPQLKELETEGLIAAFHQPDSNSKASKKYTITDQGKEELQQWLMIPVEKEIIRYEVLLKLYFSNAASSDIMLEHIKEFELNHNKQRKLFEKFEEQLKQDIDVHGNHRQVLMVLAFGQKVWESYASWCKETIKSLEDISANPENSDKGAD